MICYTKSFDSINIMYDFFYEKMIVPWQDLGYPHSSDRLDLNLPQLKNKQRNI